MSGLIKPLKYKPEKGICAMLMVYLQMMEAPEDQSKFEKLYREYRGLMYHVAFEILQNEQDSEDAVHQAFLNVIENIRKIDEPVCPKTKSYVVTIVENRAIDAYRLKNKRREIPYNEEVLGLRVEYAGSFVVTRCMAQLPPRQREVLLLKHRHGFSNREIATALKITEANAIKLEQRAKHKLAALCKEEGIL